MKLQLKWWRQGNRNIEVAASGHLYVNKQLSQEEIHLPWEEIRLDENWLGQVYLSSRDCIMWLQPFFSLPVGHLGISWLILFMLFSLGA